MDDAKMEALRSINRELALYLKQQHKTMSNCLLTVAAMRAALETNPDLREAYKAKVGELSKDPIFQNSLTSSNTLAALVQSLTDW